MSVRYCSWVKWSEMPSNPDGFPSECVAKYIDVASQNASLPEGFSRITTVEEFHAHVDANRAALAAHDALMEWKTVTAPAKIKAEAQRRIFALTGYNKDDPFPGLTRQLNMACNSLRILARKVLSGIEPTAEESALISAGIALIDKVNAVRAYSDTLEARAAGGEVFDVQTQPWPY